MTPRSALRAITVALVALVALKITPARAEDDIVHRWNETALQAVRDTLMGPPIVARMFAIMHTAMFDAWSAFDANAVATISGDKLRRPATEHTLANKREAISYAACAVLAELFPGELWKIQDAMRRLGYAPNNGSTNIATPTGIGNAAAYAVLRARRYDGANQRGTFIDDPYFDNTRYRPVNTTTNVVDPNRWQPLRVVVPYNDFFVQGFLVPHWGNVTPFALRAPDQFMPTPPAKAGSNEYLEQAREVLELSANLTDRQKSIAEFWSASIATESPPGQWMVLAQFVSERDRHTVDQDIKMYFALSNALFDTSIASWHAKRTFDYVRPITAIRHLFADQTVQAWGGPKRGTQSMRGREWMPYQADTFVTPPFAEYYSGHSAFSAAAAAVLRAFTGSDRYGGSVRITAGSSLIEPGVVPAQDVVLTWDTFTAAADEAGLSRRYGGIHFKQGDLEGRRIGKLVGEQAWAKALTYLRSK